MTSKLLDDLTGHTLAGRYRVISRTSKGPVGDLYGGRDLLLDRPVTIEVVRRPAGAGDAFTEAFESCARAAARLAHPNVAAVLDWGAEDDGTHYVVMEHVRGTLSDLLAARGRLEPHQALKVAAEVCDAVHAAQQAGLGCSVLSPDGVLLTRAGVKVAGLGAAPAGPRCAPELVRGPRPVPASDVWSIGVLLFELLTGGLPAGAGPPAPSRVDPSLPSCLDEVVATSCASDPRRRFPDPRALGLELRRMRRRLPGTARASRSPGAPGARRPPRPRMKPRHRLVAVAALVALLAAAAAGAARAVVSLLGPHEVRVPRVVGMAAAAARERLGDAGLEMDVSAQVSSLSVSPGRVLSQTPAAGAAEQGSRVRVVLSAGPPVATVPDVTGLALDAAAVRVRAAGMTVGRVTRTYSAASRGTVVGQEPASGRARWGSEVALVVSRGPEQTTVPAVTGSTAARAKRALLEAGLMPRIVLHSESAPRGRVLSTSPRAGAVVSKGATVEVTVSRGPTRRTVVVPDVRTGDVRSAAARLERLGLRVRVARSCRGGTTVVETDPVAGASIRQSEVVTLFVC